MSLQVWLPLNGNLNNNGIANITITNDGATVNDNGKIGKCYSFNGGTNKISIPNIITTSTNEFSISSWVYVTQYSYSNYTNILSCRTTTSGKGIAIWVNKDFIRFDDGEMYQANYTFQLNTWVHICIIWSKINGKYVYVNGTQIGYKATVGTLSNLATNTWIGNDSVNNNYGLIGKINDFRIYDHVLSEKEVKELSKGLILHYPLNGNGRSGNNLITNSTGYNGTTTWTGEISVGIENDKPYFITKRTNTSSTSRTFVYKLNGITSLVGSWIPGTKFTISGYYRIPSSETYNVAANLFIRWRLSTESDNDTGFSTPTSNIVKDKWIRFEKTFSVPTNYAGGSANFYLSAFAQGLSTVHWKNVKMELGEVATPWIPNSSDTVYSKMGYNLLKIYDTSGYGNNSTLNSTPEYSNITPRYFMSTYFGDYNTPKTDLDDISIFPALTGCSISWWEYCTTTGNSLSFTGNDTTKYIAAGSSTNRLYDRNIGSSGITLYKDGIQVETTQGATVYHPGTFRINNEWHHFVLTGANLSEWTQFHINSYSASYPTKAYVSDLRIYSTILSADDVKELYNTVASISDNGKLFSTGEFAEM